MKVARAQVPAALVEQLRRICLDLPQVREEAAWTGTRWVVRGKNFAHVLHIEAGWPPAYARAAKLEGPADVLTFRSAAAEFNVHAFAQAPFFRPGWWPDVVGMVLDGQTDWNEVALLLEASHRRLAPHAERG
jgi:hypothetical protein